MDIIMDWRELSHGSSEQKNAFRILELSGVMSRLELFSPTLIGTFPLDLQIDGSDLDIACHAEELATFQECLTKCFSRMLSFRVRTSFVRGAESVIANFVFESLPFEIFAQKKAVADQYGYRHLLVESILLQIGGEKVKSEIRKLKQSGLKTEPAFAKYFNLVGDPYEKLYELSFLDESEIRKILRL